jgi:predicted adenylyl cyclase CyaB
MPNSIEIEIKSLLGDRERVEEMKQKILERNGQFVSKNKQLNHYFLVSDISGFKDVASPLVSQSRQDEFEKIIDKGRDFSIRTREVDSKVFLVVKASLGEDTSANGVSRLEFESETNMSLIDLDQLLLDGGLTHQAKWSREREEYKLGDVNICIDKNAGYGYLAEFEKVITEHDLLDSVKRELADLMKDFGVEELSQARLERMFAHYNENWRDYYGTEKVFNIN